MASRLYYLLTYLPPLPELGAPVDVTDLMKHIRDECSPELNLIADLLELEKTILQVSQKYYIENTSFIPELPEWLPEGLRANITSFTEVPEAQWMNKVYSSWFKLICEVSSKTGSSLLKLWATWEWSLRFLLMKTRIHNSVFSTTEIEQQMAEIVNITDTNVVDGFNLDEVINKWQQESNPMLAEKILDKARIDFVKDKSVQYSFEIDELVAYMIELRVHSRYAQLSLEEGRKILKEVTAL